MARLDCVNGTLDDTNYSSPMPMIGLYIAAASLVCFLSILFDIVAGLRNRKQWLPCRFFSLNSITLTLLSIAAKIPVDLTTKMPTPQDQLSKLTGTTFMCICMGFIMPSLGINRESECWNNVVAMSILIVTVVVNICIQMYTGVIILFRTEHVTVLCFMMILLLTLLCSAFDINSQKGVSVNQNKDLFMKGKRSMLQRLKFCYLYAYDSNPQLELCKDVDYTLVSVLCILSSFVLVQAAFRSFLTEELKFCEGLSDYKWSIWFIIMTQIATIIIGSLGISFRWITLAFRIELNTMGITWPTKDVNDVILKNPLLFLSRKDALMAGSMYTMSFMVVCAGILVSLPFLLIRDMVRKTIQSEVLKTTCCSMCKAEDPDIEDMKEFECVIHEGEKDLEKWVLVKGMEDMRKWMEVNKNCFANSVIQLLSKTPPSQESLTNKLKELAGPRKLYEVSSLSIVLLVRIATISIPLTLSGSLTNILSELFEVIHFIERKMSSASFENKKKYKLAKAAWPVGGLIIQYRSENSAFQFNSNLDRAMEIIGGLKEDLPLDLVRDELCIITNFIMHQGYDELYGCIEQLFVDMLNELLTQLPIAVFKEIVESNPEDYEETIRFALKVLCKVESLEPSIRWSYPVGTNILKLITFSSYNL